MNHLYRVSLSPAGFIALLALAQATAFAQVTPPAPAAPATETKPITPVRTETTADGKTVVLSPYSVDASRDVGFVAASALAGGRLATDLKDTPIAYSVLTREFIDALGVGDVTEAAMWTTNTSLAKDDGRSTQFGRVGFNDLVNFRGVPANRAMINFFPVHFDYDSFNLERFDFARGPNSILFGTGSLGGSANGMYKEASTAKPIYDLSLRAGSWDYYRATIDLNQPLGEKMAIRFNGLWQQNNTWRDREWQEREGGSLHFMARPWKGAKIVAVAEMGEVRRSYGTTTIGDRLSSWDGVTTFSGPLATAPNAATGTQRVNNPPALSYIFSPGGGPQANSVVNWAAMAMTATSHQTTSRYGSSRTPVVGGNPGLIPEAMHNRINVPADWLGAAESAGFVLPGREFSAAFDDTAYLNEYENYIVSMEQQIGQHIFLYGAVNSSEGLRGVNFGTARGLKDGIQIDINQNLPGGGSNPYFLEPYIQTTNDFDQVDTTSDQLRGSIALVYDRTRWGDFRFNLEGGHEKLINSREKYRYAVSDPLVDARLWASNTLISWRYYYLSENDRPMKDLGSITVVDPVAGTSRTLPTAYTLDTGRPTETIYTEQVFDYLQASFNAKLFKEKLNLIAAVRQDEYSTDSKIHDFRMDLPTSYNGVDVVYKPVAPANYNSLMYVPKNAAGVPTGQSQAADARPRDGAGVGLPQYANDIFKDDFSPPKVSGDNRTYSYGAVYHVTPAISVFANYAETWSPPGVNLTIYGEIFGPDVSEGIDMGVRFALLDNRLNVSVIRYEGEQKNLTVSTGSNGANINTIAATNVLGDLSASGINARGLQDVPRTYSDTVSRKTEGWEFEATANLAPGWRLLANLAIGDATQGDAQAATREYFAKNQNLMKQILADAGVTVGSNNVATVNAGVTPANSPDANAARDAWNSFYQSLQNVTVGYQKVARLNEITGNLFTDYTIQSGALKNFRFGAGLQYRGKEVIGFRGSDTIQDPANATAAIDDPSVDAFTPVYNPDYFLVTAMLGYHREIAGLPVRFDLRIENVFDEDQPLYYNTVMRPPGGNLSTPARVATPNLFSYITPRNYMFTVSVRF